MVSEAATLGIVAGSGLLPIAVAERARAAGRRVVIVAHRGETDPCIEQHADSLVWVHVGQLGAIIRHLKRGGAQQVVFAGGISRVSVFRGIRLDLTAVRLIASLRSFRDDLLLRGVAGELEKAGLSVIAASEIVNDWIPGVGVLAPISLDPELRRDVVLGWEVAREIGCADVGQTVVVNQGAVVAVEAVEGTDRAIRRGAELSGPGVVVVKLCKPNQDTRLDLPSIGVTTVATLSDVKARALVCEAGKTFVIDPDAVVRAAVRARIGIVALDNPQALGA